MAHKSKVMTTNQPPRFPKEAFDYNDDVRSDIVSDIKRERGIDCAGDEWEVVDGFGQIVHA